MIKSDCLFCNFDNPDQHTLVAQNELAYARWDNFPVSEGHAEIVPKRHVDSFFDLEEGELTAMYGLAKVVREIIIAGFSPDAFTIGINDGEAAGRTIHHLHMHLMPRYVGDVENPRGGIRHIIPGKGDYQAG